jgi:hypothetical protein
VHASWLSVNIVSACANEADASKQTELRNKNLLNNWSLPSIKLAYATILPLRSFGIKPVGWQFEQSPSMQVDNDFDPVKYVTATVYGGYLFAVTRTKIVTDVTPICLSHSLRPGMRLVVHLLHLSHRQLCIPLRRRQPLMPQHLLNRS